MSTRPLTAPENEAFRLARMVAAEVAPYLMTALFAARPVAAPGLGTFAVDASWRLYLDPDCLVGEGSWSTPLTAGVLLHEVGHLVRDHAGRTEGLARPHHALAWNLATDAEINDDLLAAGVALPEGVVTPADLACESGDFAENYYAALTGSDNLPDDGGGGCGSGAGTVALGVELPPGDTMGGAAEAVSDAEGDLLRRRIARDVLDHGDGGMGRGTVPAGLTRWATRTLVPPTVPWTRVLRASVRRAVADCAGRVTYSYRRPSRRRVPRVLLPAMRAPKVAVAVVVDTSGSMSQDALDAALSEVDGVLRASQVDGVTVVACDADATRAQRVRSATAVTLAGGGGTDMRVGIDAAMASKPTPNVIVVLTDGYTPWPDRPGRARLVCGIINDGQMPPTPAWATTVHITTGSEA